MLSGLSLANVGNDLQTYKVQKLVGALDYEKIRHTETPLTDKELAYMKNDILVVMAFIAETMEKDGDISKIPLTKTGYVRNYCRKECLYAGQHHRRNQSYFTLIHNSTITAEQYTMLKAGFAGGFTHANAFYSGKVIEDVTSYDFTSSYPAQMVAQKYPIGKPEQVEIENIKQLEYNCNVYCCLFDIEFIGITSKLYYDHYISRSKCHNASGVIEDNGRIVAADKIQITLTEQDFYIIKEYYQWVYMRIGVFYRWVKAYLPREFVNSILKLYSDKTTLKGVDGKEAEYMAAKGMINACYGMSVTDIVKDNIIYTDDWELEAADVAEQIDKYNNSPRRFLYYPWGIWVTAYARRALFSGISEFKEDYIYSDTDSIKAKNANKHLEYINNYNRMITWKLEKALNVHKLPTDLIRPKTIKGIEKPLGVWDYDGHYKRFKTLGAKRYLYEDDAEELHLTISGVNKKTAVPWMLETYGNNTAVFNAFNDGLIFPVSATGKNTHTYLDDELNGLVTDYLGNVAEYHELSGVHLGGAEYSLSLSQAYINYLKGLRFEPE